MNLTLNLSPELEQYLLQSAERRGISVEEVTLQMLMGCMYAESGTGFDRIWGGV